MSVDCTHQPSIAASLTVITRQNMKILNMIF